LEKSEPSIYNKKKKEGAAMGTDETVIEKLKGISCLLEAYTVSGEGCRWTPEGMILLNTELCTCIDMLEKQKGLS
jgi:hypothetical protein